MEIMGVDRPDRTYGRLSKCPGPASSHILRLGSNAITETKRFLFKLPLLFSGSESQDPRVGNHFINFRGKQFTQNFEQKLQKSSPEN